MTSGTTTYYYRYLFMNIFVVLFSFTSIVAKNNSDDAPTPSSATVHRSFGTLSVEKTTPGELVQKNRKLKQRVKELTGRMNDFEKKFDQSGYLNLQAQFEKIIRESAALKQDNIELKKNDAIGKRETTELRGLVDNLIKRLDQHEQRVALQGKQPDYRGLQAQLNSEHEQSTRDNAEHRRNIAALKQENVQLKNVIAEFVELSRALTKRLDMHEKRAAFQDKQSDYRDLRAQLDYVNKKSTLENEDSRQNFARLQQENVELRSMIAELRKSADASQREATTLREITAKHDQKLSTIEEQRLAFLNFLWSPTSVSADSIK